MAPAGGAGLGLRRCDLRKAWRRKAWAKRHVGSTDPKSPHKSTHSPHKSTHYPHKSPYSSKSPGASPSGEPVGELCFEEFADRLEGGQLIGHVRNLLTSFEQVREWSSKEERGGAERPKMLVMEQDGEQLWRLCPGSRCLVKKTKDESRRPSLASATREISRATLG